MISPFSFLILLIWFFSLFFLNLANGLSILFIFSKNQLLVLLIFIIVSFVYFPFISAIIFMIYLLLLTLGFFISSFSSCFRCRVRLFTFLLFREVSLYCYEPSLLHCFYWIPWALGCCDFIFNCFYEYFYLFFDFLMCWLFRSVLFSLHMFVFLIFFFPVVDI